MTSKAFRVLLALTLLCVFSLFLFCEDAHAKDDKAKSMDKKNQTKQGVSESLGSKEWDEEKAPGAPQFALAIGSVVALIAVVKFL